MKFRNSTDRWRRIAGYTMMLAYCFAVPGAGPCILGGLFALADSSHHVQIAANAGRFHVVLGHHHDQHAPAADSHDHDESGDSQRTLTESGHGHADHVLHSSESNQRPTTTVAKFNSRPMTAVLPAWMAALTSAGPCELKRAPPWARHSLVDTAHITRLRTTVLVV